MMDRDKIVRLAEIVTQIFRLSLKEGSPDKAFLIGELRGTKELTYEEVEQLDELFTQGVMSIATEWLVEHFPTLSLMEFCDCGCGGLRVRDREGQKELLDVSKNGA